MEPAAIGATCRHTFPLVLRETGRADEQEQDSTENARRLPWVET